MMRQTASKRVVRTPWALAAAMPVTLCGPSPCLAARDGQNPMPSQSENHEQTSGPVRRDAGVHTGRGARSFTLAAEDLGLPRTTVTDAVKQLEARLGVQLLQRTTRHVSPTLDGEAYHRRCLGLIADLEDAEAAFGGAKPKGLLRVDVHGTLARHFVLPRLPDFLAEYPEIELYMSEGDRLVDLVREGIDCVLRVGDLRDRDMVARRVAMLEEITCAAPAYIDRFGMPSSIEALNGHRMVGFRSSATGTLMPLEFTV